MTPILLLVSLAMDTVVMDFVIHLLPSPGFIWHYIVKSPNNCIKFSDAEVKGSIAHALAKVYFNSNSSSQEGRSVAVFA